MDIFDIFDEPDSFLDPTSNYDDMQEKIKLDKKEAREGKSISSFLKKLFE